MTTNAWFSSNHYVAQQGRSDSCPYTLRETVLQRRQTDDNCRNAHQLVTVSLTTAAMIVFDE